MTKMILGIQLNIVNFDDNLKKTILDKLENIVSTKNNELKIGLIDSEPYWKYPEVTLCFFGIYSNKDLSVKDFTEYFDAKFAGKRGKITNDAFWSRHSQEGIFIDQSIKWVHIYIPHSVQNENEEES